MSKLNREQATIQSMIGIYCKHHHNQTQLCENCEALLNYASTRLAHCTYGEEKPACNACTIHCYKPEMRERVRKVMRYAGPRMLWYHPIIAIKHLLNI